MAPPEPYESQIERLTREFYDWERWGRGWHVWDQPVTLEPPFRPFLGHFIPDMLNAPRDDGRKPTFLGSLFERKKSLPLSANVEVSVSVPDPTYSCDDSPLTEVHVALPLDTKITKEAAEQFLLNLGHTRRPSSFEIIGTPDQVSVQMTCAEADCRQVREQLQAYFSDAIVTERQNHLQSLWTENRRTAVVDFGLSKEFMRPLRSYDRFEPDPLAGVIAALGNLSHDELALLQVLFLPTRMPWAESIMRSVTDGGGDSFFVDDPAMVKLATEKISTPLFAAVIRVAAQSSRQGEAWRIAAGVGKSLRQFIDSGSNELIPLTNDGYDDAQHATDVLTRQSSRSGMLLNSDELVSLIHLPSASVRSAKLERETRKTKAPPSIAAGHELVLGQCSHAGKTVPVTLGREQRVRHMYAIGASGTGKSTLLLNLIAQDLKNGEGLAVLDPHGDLIDQVLDRIPEERIGDVVLLDPSDEAYPIGFNILSAHSDLERNLLASDLVSVFRRLSTTFGDQMVTVLGNAIMAFLESAEGGTLSDLRRFLVEADYRQRFLTTVRDQEIVYYWQKEFPLLTGKPQGPILTRLDTFLRPKVIRYMVSQKTDRLDFQAIMDGRKILLAKLSQGLIGEENSYLLGTLLVSKLNQMAMSRQHMAASARQPFYLYVDEFHNFVTPSMAAILAGARKYNLGLILAHQELHQISNRDSDVANAVIANPFTRVCFRLGDYDAKKLEDGFSFFRAKDLQNLGVGQAICRMERAEYDFNLTTIPLPPAEPTKAADIRARVIAASREKYSMRREDVEAHLRASHPTAPNPTPQPAAEKARRSRASTKTMETVPKAPPQAAGGSSPGRGGEHHKYLQGLIKKWAESRGYAVAVEKPILDGLGSVDVALDDGKRSIACEISVTTSIDHELGNLQKCMAAGYEQVILVSSDKKVLDGARHAALSALNSQQFRKLRFLAPEALFSFIETLKVKPTTTALFDDPNQILTAKDVQELLRIDVKTIYSYAQRGLLPYVRIQSNLRFIKSEILKWMEERQFNPGSRRGRK